MFIDNHIDNLLRSNVPRRVARGAVMPKKKEGRGERERKKENKLRVCI